MTDMVSPEYNLRAFCGAVRSADPLEAMEAASAEIHAAHRLNEEATGQFDLPVGSEVQVYCDSLQMMISMLMNGCVPDDVTPEFLLDVKPLFDHLLQKWEMGNLREVFADVQQPSILSYATDADPLVVVVASDRGQGVQGNRVYDFHQQEIDNLKAAAIYTLAVCDNLKRMLEGIRDEQPRLAARAISELLDPNYQCKSYVDKVDHLIAPVNVPVNVPRRTKMHHGPDGIHYEKKFPLTIELREEPLALRAAWVIHDTVVTYLWSVWRRGNPTLVCCDALTATDELVGPRWQDIRSELRAFVNYDCDGLRQAVGAESKAAMERCRQTIVGDATATHKPNNDESQFLGITLGDREALRIVNGDPVRAEFGQKGKPWELFRELFHAGETGLSRDEIKKRVWPPKGAISENNPDQLKAMVNKLLQAICVEIKPDNHSVWRLAELNS